MNSGGCRLLQRLLVRILTLRSRLVARYVTKAILTAAEAERIINQADVSTPPGLHDRALLELLYSTGMRRAELVNLRVAEVDLSRRVARIEGKGGKHRYVPVDERACQWLHRYHDVGSGRWSGNHHGFTLMTNGLIDVDLVGAEGLDAYAGLGLGIGHNRIDASRRTPGVGGDRDVDASTTSVAWQIMAGFSYGIRDDL